MKRLPLLFAGVAMSAAVVAATETSIVEYQIDDTTFKGYVAVDSTREGKLPGVLVIPEYWGLNDYVKNRARQLADLGYVAFVADMYGDGKVTGDSQQAGQWSGEVKGDRMLMRRRAAAGLEQLKKQEKVDTEKLAAIGYCFGGTGVLEMARSNMDVDGVVSFHGGLATGDAETSETIKPKVLVLHGAVDPHVKPAEVQEFAREMKTANADWQLIAYGSAVHAFTNPDAGNDPGKGAAYNELADKRSWEAMKAFFAEIFGENP